VLKKIMIAYGVDAEKAIMDAMKQRMKDMEEYLHE